MSHEIDFDEFEWLTETESKPKTICIINGIEWEYQIDYTSRAVCIKKAVISGDVVIPSEIENCKVTEIDESTFFWLRKFDVVLKRKKQLSFLYVSWLILSAKN
jgi:hypothetical protein